MLVVVQGTRRARNAVEGTARGSRRRGARRCWAPFGVGTGRGGRARERVARLAGAGAGAAGGGAGRGRGMRRLDRRRRGSSCPGNVEGRGRGGRRAVEVVVEGRRSTDTGGGCGPGGGGDTAGSARSGAEMGRVQAEPASAVAAVV